MRVKAWDVLLMVSTVCALALTVLVVRQQMADRALTAPRYRVSRSDWRELAAGSGTLGQGGARDTVVVFTDYECPFCADLEPVLDSLASGLGASLLVRYHQLPNRGSHPFAYRAAVLAVCAERLGEFPDVHRRLFRVSSRLSDSTLDFVATGIAAARAAEWRRCMLSDEALLLIARDVDLARRLQVRGTPAVFVNGWGVRGPFTVARLDSLRRPR